MERRSLAILCAGWLSLAAPAQAETYGLLDGTITDASGRSTALTGHLEVVGRGPASLGALRTLTITDFSLAAGDRAFEPPSVIEYDRRQVISPPQMLNHILLDGEQVRRIYMRAGGDVVNGAGDGFTARFFDFRSDGPAGRAVGELGDPPLPRRFELQGKLHEVLQNYRIELQPCPNPGPPGGELPGGVIPGAGGAIEIAAGGEVVGSSLIGFQPFAIAPDAIAALVPPSGRAVLTRVSSAETSTIAGSLDTGSGEIHLVSPAGVELGPTRTLTPGGAAYGRTNFAATASAPPEPPTLEELGVTAPDGAVVTLDATGALVVETPGDLIVAGGTIDIPGITSFTFRAGHLLRVLAPIDVGGLPLHLESEFAVDIGGAIPGGPPSAPIGGPVRPICVSVLPLRTDASREIGSFSLAATSAEPVDIDVWPGRERNRVHPERGGVLPVALLGSDALQVDDVDTDSLRLGDGGAEPFPWILRRDLNRDGHLDLLLFFSLRNAGIAWGDRYACLVGEKQDGTVIEGCDAIRTGPGGRRYGREADSRRPG